MKKALILHGTANNSQGNWFPWLKKKLEEKDWEVWVPDLPVSEKPNGGKWTDYILREAAENGFEFDQETVLVGHSSGAVEAIHLLNKLPWESEVAAVYLVGVFHTDLGWEKLGELYEGVPAWDWGKIKNQADKFVVIHSDNDPHVPLAEAEFVAERLGSKVTLIRGAGHFNLESGYREFPKLAAMILLRKDGFEELVWGLKEKGSEFDLKILGKPRKLKAMSWYVTDNLGDSDYYKAVFEDGSFLLVLLKEKTLMFAEEIVAHIESISDEEIGVANELVYQGKKYILDNKNDYQSVKEMIWGKLGEVEGEVRFSDYVPVESEREELLSLGWLMKDGSRADINVVELKMDEIDWSI